MSRPVSVAVAGLGGRGKDTYIPFAKIHPELMKIAAIADIDAERVKKVAQEYQVEDKNCFGSAEEMLGLPRLADAVFICTQDRQHYGHAMAAIDRGYHVLLEKPISPDARECAEIAQAAKKRGVNVAVCHVLRYTPFFQKIKEIILSGRIGSVASIQQIENVAWWHQAHSFVRGNWRNSKESSPMILAKSCHDLDIILWLMRQDCVRLSSFGSLMHFRPENAPEGSADRCLGGCGCRESCPYDAGMIYLDSSETGIRTGHKGWPANILTSDVTEDNVTKALLEGPYGRCVYRCDNDVVDHQVVNMEFQNGATASFTMCAFTSGGGRAVKVMGTRGDITADMEENIITLTEFGKESEAIDVSKLSEDFSGHAGGDNRMLCDFLTLIESGASESAGLTSIDVSVQSHMMALAAEHSRLCGGQSILLGDFYSSADKRQSAIE